MMLSIRLRVDFDRQRAVRVSGLSEKAYIRSLTNLQNALGVRSVFPYESVKNGVASHLINLFYLISYILFRPDLDVRELAIQFGCVRLIGSVNKTLSEYVSGSSSIYFHFRRSPNSLCIFDVSLTDYWI
jgi:origin recognition complex subunit 6